MEKELKRKPKKIEEFEKTHTKQDDEPDKVVWYDERSKKTVAQRFVLEKKLMDMIDCLRRHSPVRSRPRRRSAMRRARRISRQLGARKGTYMVLGPLNSCSTRRTHCPRVERGLPQSIHVNSSS